MNTIAIWAGAVLLALVVGLAGGWYWKGVSIKAAEVTQSTDQVQAITTSVQSQAAQLSAKLEGQQAATAALLATQRAFGTTTTEIHLEISHAAFAPGPLQVNTTCPDPVDSPDFERLYNAAAQAVPNSPAPATTAAGGVP